MSDFRKLHVWQKAHSLALNVDRAAACIRPSRYASLRSQLSRSAMSIPANIAEGRRQESEREFARFLRYSINSACELEYHLQVAKDVGVVSETEFETLLKQMIEVRKMLHGLRNKLTSSKENTQPHTTDAPV